MIYKQMVLLVGCISFLSCADTFVPRAPHFYMPYPSLPSNKWSIGFGLLAGYIGLITCQGGEWFGIDFPNPAQEMRKWLSPEYSTILSKQKKFFAQQIGGLINTKSNKNEDTAQTGSFSFLSNCPYQRKMQNWEKKHWILAPLTRTQGELEIFSLYHLLCALTVGISVERLTRAVVISESVRIARVVYTLQQQLYALMILSYVDHCSGDHVEVSELCATHCNRLLKICNTLRNNPSYTQYQSIIYAIQKDAQDLHSGHTVAKSQVIECARCLLPHLVLCFKVPFFKFISLIYPQYVSKKIHGLIISDSNYTRKLMQQACQYWYREYKIQKSRIQ